MRHALALTILALFTTTAGAQEPTRVPFAADLEHRHAVEAELQGRLRAAVETRTTKGAPYSAEATTESVQVLADGNRIVRKQVTRIYRDADGRIRREQVSMNGEQRQSIIISDPLAGTSMILDPETRTAYRAAPTVALATKLEAQHRQREVTERAAAVRADVVLAEPVMASKIRVAQATVPDGHTTRDDLGVRTIEGVAAQGTRTTTVIAAGAIGNEQPITIVSEQWFSPDLQVLVMTSHSDPRTGETVYRLTNIVRADPDRSLFDVPADYTMKEAHKRTLAPLFRKQ